MLINLFTKREAFILICITLIAADRVQSYLSLSWFLMNSLKIFSSISTSLTRGVNLNKIWMYPAMYTHIHSNDKAICNLREEVSMSMENKTRTTKKKITCLVTKFQAAQVVGRSTIPHRLKLTLCTSL
jgi:hypothetical protein